MSKVLSGAELPPMSNEERGARLHQRAKSLGIFYARQFQAASEGVGRKVPRASVSKVWAGTAKSAEIYDRVESALDLIEESWSPPPGVESGEAAEPVAGLIRFTLHNVYGVGEVVAEGPVENREEVAESLARLIRDLRTSQSEPE